MFLWKKESVLIKLQMTNHKEFPRLNLMQTVVWVEAVSMYNLVYNLLHPHYRTWNFVFTCLRHCVKETALGWGLLGRFPVLVMTKLSGSEGPKWLGVESPAAGTACARWRQGRECELSKWNWISAPSVHFRVVTEAENGEQGQVSCLRSWT